MNQLNKVVGRLLAGVLVFGAFPLAFGQVVPDYVGTKVLEGYGGLRASDVYTRQYYPASINNAGTVIGMRYSSYYQFDSRPFTVTSSGEVSTPINTLFGNWWMPEQIQGSDAGFVTGGSVVANSGLIAIPFNAANAVFSPNVDYGASARALGVQQRGLAASGVALLRAEDVQSRVYEASSPNPLPPSATYMDVGSIGAALRVKAVNNQGIVVGSKIDAQGLASAFAFSPGKVSALSLPGTLQSELVDINDQGLAVGVMLPGNSTARHIFTFDTASGGVTDLGVDPGDETLAINLSGQVVRGQYLYDYANHAWVRPRVSGVTDGAPLVFYDINDAGTLVGLQKISQAPDYMTAVYVAVAIPEPSTWLMMAMGLSLVTLGRKRALALA
jgi:hypothetical protein